MLSGRFVPRPPRAGQVASRRASGFTLIELLVVMAIVGILSAITLNAVNGLRSRSDAESYIQNFATDMNRTRTNAMSTGSSGRVTLTSANSYVTERFTAGNWVTVTTSTATKASLTGAGVKTFTFDTRGFMVARDASGNVTTNTNLTATLFAGNTRPVIVTALGLARAF